MRPSLRSFRIATLAALLASAAAAQQPRADLLLLNGRVLTVDATDRVAQAVAIALQGARINPDGTQVLGGVYNFPDNRAYPVSSYSYMIVPTTEVAPFTRAKGDPLGRYILYFLCAGQQKAEQLGYSPLPKNLVQLGFDAVRKIPGAPAPPPITSCSNPTITGDFITGAAPPPDPDDGGGGGGGSTQYPRMMLEYLGSASTPGSPCASYGLPGGSNASGPLVATLVK